MSTAVAEATVTVHVDVTQGDLDTGQACKPGDCPVWHALARALPHLRAKLCVGPFHIAVLPDFAAADAFIDLPAEATAAVNAIDMGYPVKPFSFEVQVPARLLAVGSGIRLPAMEPRTTDRCDECGYRLDATGHRKTCGVPS